MVVVVVVVVVIPIACAEHHRDEGLLPDPPAVPLRAHDERGLGWLLRIIPRLGPRELAPNHIPKGHGVVNALDVGGQAPAILWGPLMVEHGLTALADGVELDEVAVQVLETGLERGKGPLGTDGQGVGGVLALGEGEYGLVTHSWTLHLTAMKELTCW